MRVIRHGKGEVAMTEGELARFFGVSWQEVNNKVRLIKQTMCLKPYGIETTDYTLLLPLLRYIYKEFNNCYHYF